MEMSKVLMSGNLAAKACCYITSKGVVGVSRGGQALEREVLCLHFGKVLADQTVNNGEIGGVANTESLVLGPHLMPWPSWVGELAATQKSASVTHDAHKLKSS
jgi:hypothetical protein